MEDNNTCIDCKSASSKKFRQLGSEIWREVESKGLVRELWSIGCTLCNVCYMRYVANPRKEKKTTNKEITGKAKEKKVVDLTENEAEEADASSINYELVKAISSMARVLHKREVKEKQKPIYNFDELRELLENKNFNLSYFFDQLYLAARPSERTSQTMERMKNIIVFICYLLASLNNTQINAFKSDIAFYLDSSGTSNEGLNILSSMGITPMARTISRKKKKITKTHEEFIKDNLIEHLNNALMLNIDDYHNVHVQRQPHTTNTSLPIHMVTIVANLCLTPAILRDQVFTSKVVDGELVIRHIDKRFMVNLGVSYFNFTKNCIKKEYTNVELLEKLTLHSYDDRLIEKKTNGI
ncbi:hypothetical protein C2G38_2042553 [Gigaspora rosea]|uniref:Uncharacterized protein n=1 Tax=Gigaspora rosea TaxID=44941 RepID=A0A397UMY1_9GLOM|nr:hypothetical protein C2G38_2042553 [Gigaspora rosea]